jgi:hypothetical protein
MVANTQSGELKPAFDCHDMTVLAVFPAINGLLED